VIKQLDDSEEPGQVAGPAEAPDAEDPPNGG
jgi:hypothetical protein